MNLGKYVICITAWKRVSLVITIIFCSYGSIPQTDKHWFGFVKTNPYHNACGAEWLKSRLKEKDIMGELFCSVLHSCHLMEVFHRSSVHISGFWSKGRSIMGWRDDFFAFWSPTFIFEKLSYTWKNACIVKLQRSPYIFFINTVNCLKIKGRQLN